MLPAEAVAADRWEEEARKEGFADMGALEQAFQTACEVAAQSEGPVSFANNSDKLRLYAFFKQVFIASPYPCSPPHFRRWNLNEMCFGSAASSFSVEPDDGWCNIVRRVGLDWGPALQIIGVVGEGKSGRMGATSKSEPRCASYADPGRQRWGRTTKRDRRGKTSLASRSGRWVPACVHLCAWCCCRRS